MNANVRAFEQARAAAEPSHLDALLAFAERAYRRPLAKAERDDLRRLLPYAPRADGSSHEDAVRDTVVSVLMSPHFCYRVDPLTDDEAAAGDVRPLSDYDAGQPAELLPLVEHARRRAADARRGRRPAQAGGARRPGPADAAATTASAAWPPSSPATGSTSAASRSTTASTASGSRASRTSCARRCSRSRSASSSTSSSAIRSVLDFLVRQPHVRQPGPGQALRHAGADGGRTSGCASTTRSGTAAAGCCRWRSS